MITIRIKETQAAHKTGGQRFCSDENECLECALPDRGAASPDRVLSSCLPDPGIRDSGLSTSRERASTYENWLPTLLAHADEVIEWRCLAVTAHGRLCEGFRMPAADERAAGTGGRRPKTSKGGNRALGTYGGAASAMGI